MIQLSVDVDRDLHAKFKAKAATERLTMGDVVRWAIQDYVDGKWKARPYNRQPKKDEKPMQ